VECFVFEAAAGVAGYDGSVAVYVGEDIVVGSVWCCGEEGRFVGVVVSMVSSLVVVR